FVSNNKDRFLKNLYLKSKRSVAKATNEGPAAWISPSDQSRVVEAADMMNLLRLMGVEVHKADKEIVVKDQKFPAGSYVIRMDQPYSRMADMLLDTQYYNVSDPRPYDDTGWTLGPLKNVKTVRVTDPEVLKVPMTLLPGAAIVRGKLAGPADAAAYLIPHNTDNTLMVLRYRLKDVRLYAAEEPFKAGDLSFPAGTFIIRASEAPAGLRERLEKEVTDLGLTATGVAEAPNVATHE